MKDTEAGEIHSLAKSESSQELPFNLKPGVDSTINPDSPMASSHLK